MRLTSLVTAALTALCLLAAPVFAGGSPAAARTPVVRGGTGPVSGAFNVITARSVLSRLGSDSRPSGP